MSTMSFHQKKSPYGVWSISPFSGSTQWYHFLAPGKISCPKAWRLGAFLSRLTIISDHCESSTVITGHLRKQSTVITGHHTPSSAIIGHRDQLTVIKGHHEPPLFWTAQPFRPQGSRHRVPSHHSHRQFCNSTLWSLPRYRRKLYCGTYLVRVFLLRFIRQNS